jgi:predicted Zn-dependent protease
MSFGKTQFRIGWRIVSVVVLSLTVVGCFGTISQDREISAQGQQRFLSQASKKENFLSVEQREELRILDANGGVYQDTPLQAVIKQIVDRLAASSEAPALRYNVTILDSPAVNAFSLPSGRLFVTRGLLALANDSSELASVISHEMAHISARHAAIRQDRILHAGGVADTEVGALAFGNLNVSIAKFSRNQELEADSIGAGIASRAEYDPYGAVRFLSAIARNVELGPLRDAGEDQNDLWHPPTSERLANAKANAERYATPGPRHRDRAAFLASIDGLIYGQGMNAGFVQRRRLLQPSLGFSFSAPEGFVLHQTASATLGLRERGEEALRIDFVQMPLEHSLTDYVTSGWLENIGLSSIEHVNINGFRAVTATTESDQWAYRVFVIRLDRGVCRLVFAARSSGQEFNRTFRDAVSTFRRISSAEILATTPHRLKNITVQPGDTPGKLAKHMATADRPLERFLVLNGLQPGQALQPGDRVKIVTRMDRADLR